MKILFEQALQRAIEFAKSHEVELGTPVLLVRDLFGRIRIAMETSPDEPTLFAHKQLAAAFSESLQNYAPVLDAVFLYGNELFAPDAIFSSPDKHRFEDSNIYVLDRQITNQDWLRSPLQTTGEQNPPPRATLFGIKGGVGRSTALAVWAWHLAKHGKRVLVLDLDLESPGISRMLLPADYTPDFGIVDWFMENAIGQANTVLPNMVGNSPLMATGMGWIRVVPAAGAQEGDYLAKLSRVYLDLNHGEHTVTFAERLADLLKQLEHREQPDVVLIDSRAGLHDIAAVSITRLDALALLFAINSPQTWQAYRFLFSHWQRWGQTNLPDFRNNLKIVAGMVPETGVADYLARCRQSAYDLFAETLYEEDDGTASDVFNFAENLPDAPHYPLKIHWNRAFLEFDPIHQPELFDTTLVQAVYGSFLEEATLLALGENL
jgi:CheY-like chemotaxis protein